MHALKQILFQFLGFLNAKLQEYFLFWNSLNNVSSYRKWQQCQLFFSQEHLGHIPHITWIQQSRHTGISASRWLEYLCFIYLAVNLAFILLLDITFFVFCFFFTLNLTPKSNNKTHVLLHSFLFCLDSWLGICYI